MSKRGRRENLEKARRRSAPQVHVKVASASPDLRAAAALVKPAILYADKVTIFSPSAWMLTAVADFSAITDPRQQASTMLDVVRQVPSIAPELDLSDGRASSLQSLLRLDPSRLRQMIGRRQAAKFEAIFDGLSAMFSAQMPEVLEKIKVSTGAEELTRRIDSGAVFVAGLTDASPATVVADCVRAASGLDDGKSTSELVEQFADRIVEILIDGEAFPLLDGQSSDLARAIDALAGVQPSEHGLRRSAEVTAATQLMGYLPYFPDLPMDEVLDLRRELQSPLIRFRAAMCALSGQFMHRSFDEKFASEVADAWRATVAPALTEIREALAEHGLLREVASVALGNPRRLAIDAGGVVLAGAADIGSLSHLTTVGVATALPLADVLGQAIDRRRQTRAQVRRNAFYFLHKLESEAIRRSA